MISADLNFDAFSNGQIESKLWMRDELLRALDAVAWPPPIVWILGGWYALSAFVLLSANESRFRSIRSFDIDEDATEIANRINNNWEINGWKFRAMTADCNFLNYLQLPESERPDVVINTAVEHFASASWWVTIPRGKLVVLQSNNAVDVEGHSNTVATLEEFAEKFPLRKTLFRGQREFRYPTWSFSRFMLIGLK